MTATTTYYEKKLNTLKSIILKAKSLHSRKDLLCVTCGTSWPCATIVVLDDSGD